MKTKLLISLIILGSTLTMNAQWTTNTVTATISTDDNVDIGYDLSGNSVVRVGGVQQAPSTTALNGVLRLITANTALDFGTANSTIDYAWIQSLTSEGPPEHPLSLNPIGANVGVGLTAPASLFHSAGRISTGIPSTGLGGASATTGSLLFYNATNANTVTINSGTTSVNYGMTLPINQGAASTVLTNDGTGALSWAANNGSGWSLTGNLGTTAGTNYIGTNDATDWVVKTNTTERMRVLSTGYVGVGTASPNDLLEVYHGTARITGSNAGEGVKFQSTSSTGSKAGLYFVNSSGTVVYPIL